jgi:plastocyanin
MERDSVPSRRELLGALAGTTAVGLAGCFAGEDDETPERGENTVVVGPDGTNVFDSDSLTVAVGETVTWTWDSNTHNVVVESQPDGADWSGTDGGATETYDEGYEYTHTFDTAGTYEYYCSPHRGLGMEGEVVVEEN